ncbi:MAG: hypothetical protein JXA03_14415 [Bacteroidales bacterium]|nr:hypothetical protein [Bacteroidales bacterium]
MKKTLIIALILTTGLIACNKEDKRTFLSGIYTETSPVPGRSQLNFTSDTRVVKTEPDSSFVAEFTYELVKNQLKLTPTSGGPATEYYFELITATKFIIEDFYPPIPDNPTSFVTYEK